MAATPPAEEVRGQKSEVSIWLQVAGIDRNRHFARGWLFGEQPVPTNLER
jgi:hypothetical protein